MKPLRTRPQQDVRVDPSHVLEPLPLPRWRNTQAAHDAGVGGPSAWSSHSRSGSRCRGAAGRVRGARRAALGRCAAPRAPPYPRCRAAAATWGPKATLVVHRLPIYRRGWLASALKATCCPGHGLPCSGIGLAARWASEAACCRAFPAGFSSRRRWAATGTPIGSTVGIMCGCRPTRTSRLKSTCERIMARGRRA